MEDEYDWEKEVEEFERTKGGVKGLVDSCITKVPKFFTDPSERFPDASSARKNGEIQVQVPVIDLQALGSRRQEVVEEIRCAAEKWGFFQMINHEVPGDVMENVLEATRKFHEQPKEAKRDLYSADGGPKVRFYTLNGSFKKSYVASWRDALACNFFNDFLEPEAIPPICRKEITEYAKHMMKLRDKLCGILSEALGLSGDYLREMECMRSDYLTCLYYPACPEPDKTLGTVKHSDPGILTVIVQDHLGGLQILHENQWVDVPPIPGALIANIGDLLQIISNDKFKSVEHRVLSRSKGSRVSTACFLYPSLEQMSKPYGPIKELLSPDNPPVYKRVSYLDYVTFFQQNVETRTSSLSHFKL